GRARAVTRPHRRPPADGDQRRRRLRLRRLRARQPRMNKGRGPPGRQLDSLALATIRFVVGRAPDGNIDPMKGACHLVVAASLLLSAKCAAAHNSSRGGVALESRAFDPDDDENTEDYGIAVSSQMEVKFQSRPWSVVLRGFTR